MKKRLYIWVEGPDDRRFFEHIARPLLLSGHESVLIREYSGETPDFIRKFLKTITNMGDRYIFVTDMDDAPCITAKKARLQQEYNEIDQACVLVVRREIESWYLAGLDAKQFRQLRIRNFRNTESVSKEQFNLQYQRTGFASRIDLMSEILKVFSLDEARERNNSLRYFIEKYLER